MNNERELLEHRQLQFSEEERVEHFPPTRNKRSPTGKCCGTKCTWKEFRQWLWLQAKLINISNFILLFSIAVMISFVREEQHRLSEQNESAKQLIDTIDSKLSLLSKADAILDTLRSYGLNNQSNIIDILNLKSKVNTYGSSSLFVASQKFEANHQYVLNLGWVVAGETFTVINAGSASAVPLSNWPGGFGYQCTGTSSVLFSVTVQATACQSSAVNIAFALNGGVDNYRWLCVNPGAGNACFGSGSYLLACTPGVILQWYLGTGGQECTCSVGLSMSIQEIY